jgi:hypothetical protein
MPRRVVAKVEWHLGELYPRVGFIVTNLSRPSERVVASYSKRGTCEQWIKEGKNMIKWTRLSCCSFAANAVRLQLHASAHGFTGSRLNASVPTAPRVHPGNVGMDHTLRIAAVELAFHPGGVG